MEPNSLIIASRNRPELLADAVESVLNGTRLPTELIVVDQSDRAHPTLAGKASSGPCELRYIWSRSRGLSRANNLGVEAARYDLLAFAHDDVRVSTHFEGRRPVTELEDISPKVRRRVSLQSRLHDWTDP